jgi:hypothetical protein
MVPLLARSVGSLVSSVGLAGAGVVASLPVSAGTVDSLPASLLDPVDGCVAVGVCWDGESTFGVELPPQPARRENIKRTETTRAMVFLIFSLQLLDEWFHKV